MSRRVRLTIAAEARTLPGPGVPQAAPTTRPSRPRSIPPVRTFPEMPAEDPVLASEPVEWLAEFRFFVRDRRVHAWSPYWLHGALGPAGADEWVRRTRDGCGDKGGCWTVCSPILGSVLPRRPGHRRRCDPWRRPRRSSRANEASGAGIYGVRPEGTSWRS